MTQLNIQKKQKKKEKRNEMKKKAKIYSLKIQIK